MREALTAIGMFYKTSGKINIMRFGLPAGFAKVKADEAHHHTSLTKPSDNEISIFEDHLKSLPRKADTSVLILGSSPELRELAARLNVKATVVANDLEVIERTTRQMKKRNKKEEWLEGDIIGLPLEKGSFDVIFSDHFVANVSPFNKDNFYDRMKEILKDDGFVVIRSMVLEKMMKPFENRLSKYFTIIEKKFGKEGVFSGYFPIYLMRPKQASRKN